MILCSYTNFGALFSTVDVEFRFFAYTKIFEIGKFVYCHDFGTCGGLGQNLLN